MKDGDDDDDRQSYTTAIDNEDIQNVELFDVDYQSHGVDVDSKTTSEKEFHKKPISCIKKEQQPTTTTTTTTKIQMSNLLLKALAQVKEQDEQ